MRARLIDSESVDQFNRKQEDHFFDRKSHLIAPAKLSQSLSAFANADGGELLVGIEDDGTWVGFTSIEDANGLIDVIHSTLQGGYFDIGFLETVTKSGFVLHLTINRSPALIASTSGDVYVRQSAQNHKCIGEELDTLRRAKGDVTYEINAVSCDLTVLTHSEIMVEYMLEGLTLSEPEDFLRKQALLQDGKPAIVAVLLFADVPQAYVPYAAVKVYRYATSGEARREHMVGAAQTIEGPIYRQISEAEEITTSIISSIPKLSEGHGFRSISYPPETLHEILTNAVLHRDYGMKDYVHVKIFDNRVEIESPGRLPAHVTVANILDERYARNPLLQRLLHRFPDPPNMDIGEGLNTAFQAMEKLRLSHPRIEESSDRVRVTVAHDPLASPQEAIVKFTTDSGQINNTQAREVTKIEQERTIRRYFEELVSAGELVRSGSGRGTYYTRPRGRLPDMG